MGKMIQPLNRDSWVSLNRWASLPPSFQHPALAPAVLVHVQPPRSLLPCCVGLGSRPPSLALPIAPSPLAWVDQDRGRPFGTAGKQEAKLGPDSWRPTPRELRQKEKGALSQPLWPRWVPEEAVGPVQPFRRSLACSWMMHRLSAQLRGYRAWLCSWKAPNTFQLAQGCCTPPSSGATCSQGGWASRDTQEMPRYPRPRWREKLNFPRDKHKRQEEKVPPPPSPRPARTHRRTYLHPSRSRCHSRPAARCSRSLRTWPRCPCTPAPRSAP